MARFAGKLIIRLIPPRVVAMLWWEYLMLIAGAWFSCVVGIAYFHGILLNDYPAVLLTPFIPSVIALIVRLCYTMPLNPTDGPRFVLNACHVVAVPLAFTLLFLKMWNNLGAIDWWIVAVIPTGVLTRAVIDQLWDVVMEFPKTEYNQLGYGREGGAWEYAFSEPQDDDVEIVEEKVSRKSSSSKYVKKGAAGSGSGSGSGGRAGAGGGLAGGDSGRGRGVVGGGGSSANKSQSLADAARRTDSVDSSLRVSFDNSNKV